MRHGISWHQLVEWQQSHAINPFGEERADLRSATAGATIANEIRTIAAGLAGVKTVTLVQVKDLMIDTGKARLASSSRSRRRSKQSNDDRAAAESYHNAWARSLEAKLKHTEASRKSKSAVDRKRTTSKPSRRS